MDIDLVFRKHYCDKANDWHCYSSFYDSILSPIREEKRSILEIGIFRGESLKAWWEYLPNFQIVAVDVCDREETLRRTKNVRSLPRINCVFGDSTLKTTADEVERAHGSFDLIIDDGMHLPYHNLHTFLNFFPLLKEGGKYIIEDVYPLHIEGFDAIREQLPKGSDQHKELGQYNPKFYEDVFMKTLYENGRVTFHDARHLSKKNDSYIIMIEK